MKAATGELNLTLITVVAIGLIAALFYTVLWPNIRGRLTDEWNNADDMVPEVSHYEFTQYIETELF